MRDLTKAQLTIGILACFSIGIGTIQNVITSTDLFNSLLTFTAQLIAVFVLVFVLLAILQWVNIFDLKTNSLATLLVLIPPLLLLLQ